MANEAESFLPLTPQMYYVLVSLRQKRHGYGIMQDVEELTDGHLKLGPGTLYGILSRMENRQLIEQLPDDSDSSRKNYSLTLLGKQVVQLEFTRLRNIVLNTQTIIQKME